MKAASITGTVSTLLGAAIAVLLVSGFDVKDIQQNCGVKHFIAASVGMVAGSLVGKSIRK